MIEYIALFIENDEDIKKLKQNEQSPLIKLPKNYHVTFEYKPQNIEKYNEILNKRFEIRVVGYASNGENSAFKVEFPKDLNMFYNRRTNNGELVTPHITMSMGKSGKAVNSCYLKFDNISPFKVAGIIKCFEFCKDLI